MIVLACETSTLLGSVSLIKDGSTISSRELMRQGSHSEGLNIMIQEVLQEACVGLDKVDLFATGIGPGSFTGIRICLNSMKTFAYCYQKKIVGVNSLENLAFGVKSKQVILEKGQPIISMINAYKNMLYVGMYQVQDVGLVELRSPEVIRVQNLKEYIKQEAVIVGDGYAAYEKYFDAELKKLMIRSDLFRDEPTSENLGLMSFNLAYKKSNWNEILPVYLRASEAEENLKGIKYQPLF